MRKNQANVKKINNKNKNFLCLIHPTDWVILGLFIFSILSNILLFIFRPELMDSVSTLLFQLLHLIFGIRFAYRVAKISQMDKITEVQKSIAKTATRQIRGVQFMVEKLMEIINSKINSFQDNKMIDTMKDINNHLSSLRINISLSESAFKDILGEEFKEEYLLLTKINEGFSLLNEKVIQEKKLRKKNKKEHKTRQSELQDEIDELRSRISSDISSLPITGLSGASGPSGASGYQSFSKDDWVKKLLDIPLIGDDWVKKLLDTSLMGKGISIEEKEQKEDKKS